MMSYHERFVRDKWPLKRELRCNSKLMSIVSFLVPLLAGLKRRMKIPDLNNLLPLMTGEDVRTERELPPLILPVDFRSQLFSQFATTSQSQAANFTESAAREKSAAAAAAAASTEAASRKYFHLHGAVQVEMDTCSLDQTCQKYSILLFGCI